MGTKSTNTNQGTFNQPSMGAFNQMQGPYTQTLGQYAQNPFGNPFMQTQQQLGTKQAGNLNQAGTSNLMQNMTASGMMGGAGSPAGLEMLQNQNRAGTANTANLGFLQPMQNAQQMQQFALGQQGQYRPFQTGGVQTQTTGGLGTWLPQVAGMALGGLTGGLGGMMRPQSPMQAASGPLPMNMGSFSPQNLYNQPQLPPALGQGGNQNPFLQQGYGGFGE